MVETILSKNQVPVRLTDERWTHITEEHCELAGMRLEILETLASLSRILAGKGEEQLAVREVAKDKYLIVVYREMSDDGFMITAFLTRKLRSLNKRKQLWPS
ncbi:MAG: hypothetical protein VX610_10110 [SAR324 cluster bacterium]|nr:hypothetical protein [SAR324 cluster bacterium]